MQDVKRFLDAFLDSPNPGVIAIKGDWGAGKTYFVTHYLQARLAIPNKLVSFVSLFGLSDMEQIRRRIFPSAISAKKLKEGKTTSWLQAALGLGRRLPRLSDFDAALQALEDYLARNLLVVFDDVERKSASLPLKDFLGLVNFLAEHAACKVIIVLNENELLENDKRELGIFREKLIDREVLFAPNYVDNAKLFFRDSKLFDFALDVFTRAECRNLRVINKCYQACREFERELSDLDNDRRQAVLKQVIVLACLFYQFGGQIDFADLHNFSIRAIFAKKEGEQTEQGRILEKVGFRDTDFDGAIIGFLTTGLFDSQAISAIKQTQETKGERDDIEQKQREIYKLIWANFQGTSEDFCQKLTTFLDENIERLNWDDISQASRALQRLGFNGNIHKWADMFIVRYASRFSFEECNTFSQVAHSAEAQKAITDQRASVLRKRQPKEIIYAMVTKHGWNPDDTAALSEYSVDEYVEWLRNESDERLLSVLKEFVQTFNPQHSNPEWKSIGEKVFAAFRILSKDSSFIRYKLTNNVGLSPKLLDEPHDGAP